jgi:ubiquinone/menaquinone biosynthesis C-methylase UbiE
MPFVAESLIAEEKRIREAYAKRQSGHLYSRFNPGYLLMVQEREKCLLRLLSRYHCEDLERKKFLEIGCGSGDLLRDFIKWGARPENIAGVDLLSERIAEAVHLSPKAIEIRQCNAAILDYSDETFDVVVQSTVFTSVLEVDMRRQMAAELLRVVKPTGLILWYDYHVNNPWNKDVRGVKRREIYELFPNCRIHLKRITLLPPLARVIAPYSYLICYLLEKFPPLCTHYLGVIRKG